MLKKNETIEKIGPYDFIQPEREYRATFAPYLLCDFMPELGKEDRVIDLGTGSGVIPLYLCSRGGAGSVTGVEKDRGMAALAERNMAINGLGNRVDIVNRDWRSLDGRLYPEGSFTHVVSNPPFVRMGEGRISPSHLKGLARHEGAGTLKDLVGVSRRLAGESGLVFYIYPVARFAELMVELKRAGLRPRRMRLVYTGAGKKAKLFIIESGAEGELLLESPVFI